MQRLRGLRTIVLDVGTSAVMFCIVCAACSAASSTSSIPGSESPPATMGRGALAILVAVIGLLAVLLIVALAIAFAHTRRRITEAKSQREEALPDAWKTAGERMRVDEDDDAGS